MTDIHIIIQKDRFNGKTITFFEGGKFQTPLMMLQSYEFEALIKEYKEMMKELE